MSLSCRPVGLTEWPNKVASCVPPALLSTGPRAADDDARVSEVLLEKQLGLENSLSLSLYLSVFFHSRRGLFSVAMSLYIVKHRCAKYSSVRPAASHRQMSKFEAAKRVEFKARRRI